MKLNMTLDREQSLSLGALALIFVVCACLVQYAMQARSEAAQQLGERRETVARLEARARANGPGRTITTAPASVTYGQKFSVATPNAAQITVVRWIRIGSVTHAFDFGQRANTLSFTRTSSGVDVTAPGNPNLAPPGHYLVFILNRNGVPSVGKIVRLQ